MPHGPIRAQSKSLPRGGSRCRPSFLSLSLSLEHPLRFLFAHQIEISIFPSPLSCGPRKLRKLTPYIWYVARCTVRRCLSRGRHRRRRGPSSGPDRVAQWDGLALFRRLRNERPLLRTLNTIECSVINMLLN